MAKRTRKNPADLTKRNITPRDRSIAKLDSRVFELEAWRTAMELGPLKTLPPPTRIPE